ncbi:hypothetical protein AAHA92_12052 [Salvia divinorum]|uniref:Uncharacterized protein n=1 Tax=Salvia divinorum TaxID=28513 RepID=A0ABD1HJE7_SALDI
MKGSSTLIASLFAASSLALSSSASATAPAITSTPSADRVKSMEKRSFAPKFDGLRFIETLVTAHRDGSGSFESEFVLL